MKYLITTLLLASVPALALAQSEGKAAAAKPAAKAAAKPATKAPAKPAAQGTSSRTQLKSAANQVASGIMAAEAALGPDEIKLAERVHTGKLPCELGSSVQVEADAKSPGYFNVLVTKGPSYRMIPVASRTGAIRLEDAQRGAVWLQLANKSMLMDQKAGRRLADECMSPEQAAMAQALKTNPAPSLLDAPSVQQAPLPSAAAAVAVVPASGAAAPASPTGTAASAPAAPVAPAAPASAAR